MQLQLNYKCTELDKATSHAKLMRYYSTSYAFISRSLSKLACFLILAELLYLRVKKRDPCVSIYSFAD